MRKGIVKFAGKPAGKLEETVTNFRFRYDPAYLHLQSGAAATAVLTLTLGPAPFDSPHLFAFMEA